MKLRTDLTLRQFGDGYVIVDPGQDRLDISKVYRFNETAAQVWYELQGKEFNIESVVTVLMEHYEVQKEEAERGAMRLTQQFEKEGLIIA